jgi:[protein-PII] uridylyltransferase
LTVAGADVPGLFSNICGALAAKEINIWSAQIFSTTDGFALNQFQVTDLENNPLPAGLRLERLRHDLNQVVLGEKTIESLIEKHRGRSRQRPRPRSPLPSRVLIDNTSSQVCTVIEIRTTDRPGLLYRITRALSECQLDIQRSIITTEAYGVVDVFYVTDLEYNKIYDPAQRLNIEQTILNAIDL